MTLTLLDALHDAARTLDCTGRGTITLSDFAARRIQKALLEAMGEIDILTQDCDDLGRALADLVLRCQPAPSEDVLDRAPLVVLDPMLLHDIEQEMIDHHA